MKVGPHTGMSLKAIVASKRKEEMNLGQHYWGYSGTLCHPNRVREFISYVATFQDFPPKLMLIETKSEYNSVIGHVASYSIDGKEYRPFKGMVQLQGAKYAFVARDLQEINKECQLDCYVVVGGRNNGRPLSHHLRGRVNKTFVQRSDRLASAQKSQLAFVAQLVDPFVIWLGI